MATFSLQVKGYKSQVWNFDGHLEEDTVVAVLWMNERECLNEICSFNGFKVGCALKDTPLPSSGGQTTCIKPHPKIMRCCASVYGLMEYNNKMTQMQTKLATSDGYFSKAHIMKAQHWVMLWAWKHTQRLTYYKYCNKVCVPFFGCKSPQLDICVLSGIRHGLSAQTPKKRVL